MKKVLIFGTGIFYKNRVDKLRCTEIVAFLDNDSSKWGQTLDGHVIVNPVYVNDYEFEYIILMSLAEKDMRRQLHDLGIKEQHILSYKEFLMIYGSSNNSFINSEYYSLEKKKVILFSHASDLSGAPMALIYLARTLKKMGKNPIIVCKSDGLIREVLEKEEITALITNNVSIYNPVIGCLIENSEFVVVNTVVMYPLIRQLNGLKVHVLWWLHETRLNYDDLRKANLEKFELEDNIHPFGVGRVAQDEFYHYWGKKIDSLLYTLPDFYQPRRTVFAVVGLVTRRKGQDLFVEAIERMAKNIRERAEFWIIGEWNREEEEFCSNLFKKVNYLEEVKYLGQLTRKEIIEKYDQIDVVVMPSRMDPMPIAIVEGFMNHKACILSSAIAVSDFVTNDVDGLVFESDNVNDLTLKMQDLIENPDKLKRIGEASRKIYEDNFSEKNAEEKISAILKGWSKDE